ncbi:unannotated protein [freshwater metagenome]|uniref:Unannotated protein n=1 Tax=freshwater metagenome TaxID=449393 RepID=A0A6J6MVX0_9ZZZZ
MMTALVRDATRISEVKFVGVTSIPAIGPVLSTFGFPKELRSTARAKFGGKVTCISYRAVGSTPESRRNGKISLKYA